jgi:DNA-binding transcriptional LysR family regulator
VLGEGIAWLPDFLVRDAVEAGKLAPVLSQWRPKKHQLWTYYFVYADRRYALPSTQPPYGTPMLQSGRRPQHHQQT